MKTQNDKCTGCSLQQKLTQFFTDRAGILSPATVNIFGYIGGKTKTTSSGEIQCKKCDDTLIIN